METLPLVGAGQDLTGCPRTRVLVLGKEFGELLQRLQVVVGDKDVQV